MKKQTILTIILLVGLVATGWHFQHDALAADQPETTEIGSPEEDSEPMYIEEGDMDTAEQAGDEDMISDDDSEEGVPISSEGETEDTGGEE